MVRRLLTALALLTATAWADASAAPPQLELWTRAALGRLPVPAADRKPERAALRVEQLDEFAAAIARVSADRPSPRQHAALLVTLGGAETNFETRLVLGDCAPYECDRGRARGAFQNQNVSFVRDLWPTAHGNITAQVAMADRVLRRSMTRCAAFAPFPAHVFRAYKGGASSSCSWPLKDEATRVATFNRLLSVRP